MSVVPFLVPLGLPFGLPDCPFWNGIFLNLQIGEK